MNKKLILRILGAIFSALIIVGVFVPFVSVTGYTQSLWGVYSSVNTLYLPIMLIVFGAIGVIFFSLNFKTEFAYMSTGAVLFFVVMQTIDVLDQGTFSTLSVGYYFLAIGAIATGVIAFLSNLKIKIVTLMFPSLYIILFFVFTPLISISILLSFDTSFALKLIFSIHIPNIIAYFFLFCTHIFIFFL